MKKIITLLFLAISSSFFAQIKGTVTDIKGEPISSVSIYLDNTVTGTVTNENGNYELELKKTGDYTIVFQFLGFKTLKKEINITSLPFILNAKLTEEKIVLDEVLINSKENPADRIIRSVIANKQKNMDKVKAYTADFYSRGLYKITDAPKKFLGRELGDLGGTLDSTRSGIIYLSETISKIKYQKPNNFKEHIIASKVSGMDNGVSFNRAEDVNFNLYKNTVDFGYEIISPLSNYAFGYYKFKLAGTFYDKDGRLINKIKMTPKRKNDKVFNGFVYIVEDEWALYGSDISVLGSQINLPMIDVLNLKQNYNYSEENDAWIVVSQTIDFKLSIFGFNIDGRFSSAYSNYNFNPTFDKNTFGGKILSFAKEATKKDSVYWNDLRSVPLTKEEVSNYKIKDSIKVIRKSKKYLDSIDAKRNKFSLLDLLFGYSYRNSYKKWSVNIGSPVGDLNFNTVQGWSSTVGINYFKRLNKRGKWINLGTDFNYGFSDKKLRPTAYFTYKWDNINSPILRFSGGITTSQFNAKKPISSIWNTVSSTLFERNYMKIYEKTFAKISFSKELFNRFEINSSLEFTDRKPLINTTNYSIFNRDNVEYTSNNPQNPASFLPSFNPHKMWIYTIGANISFGQKYLSYPDFKSNISNDKYPSLYIGYRKTFGSGDSKKHSDVIYSQLLQNTSLENLGVFKYKIKGGIFLKKKNIPFIDYVHFNGNKLAVQPSAETLNYFNLLDYYSFSSNDKYTEIHAEHNFEGFILNKIPLINKLSFNLVVGGKVLFTADKKPYTEYSVGLSNIGRKKWRFLRIDYVKSNGGINQKQSGFVFGISILD